MNELLSQFSDEDLIVIIEMAHIALSDGEIADQMGDEMDLSDEYFRVLNEKLQDVLRDV